MINGLIVSYDLGRKNQNYKASSRLPYGANFAIKRELIQQVGGFNLKLGVLGKQLGRGEDTDYFRRAIAAGFAGVYIADAKAYHRFHGQRMTLVYLYRYGIQKGTEAVALDKVFPHNTFLKIMYQIFAGLFQLMKLRVDRFYQCVINIGVLKGIYNSYPNSDTSE